MSGIFDQEFRGTRRFSIRRRIGAGSMGVVYHAYDRERGMDVALKTLKHHDASSIYRFKKEFRALSGMKHPNLAALYELINEDELWFFTMELVRGTDFIDYVATPSFLTSRPGLARASEVFSSEDELHEQDTEILSNPVELLSSSHSTVITEIEPPRSGVLDTYRTANLDRLRPALSQLCFGLSALHRANKLHRDLKPSNILVTGAGRVAILDFGLVAELDPEWTRSASEENGLAGTFAYMAPEAGSKDAISPAADWYSVGVLLYQALTGRLPFMGAGIDVLLEKQRKMPAPPSAHRADVPDDLSQLAMRLLKTDPRDRPSGESVLASLNPTPSISTALAPSKESVASDPFIGRNQHLGALEVAFMAAASGHPTGVFVRGIAGAGKSALVRHFVDDLREREQAIVLSGRCYERESVPYKAIDGLIDALSRYLSRLDPKVARVLLPRNIRALAKLFPVLDRVSVIAQAPRLAAETPDQQELRRRAFSALRELLGRLAERIPVVLFIDDLQWGDLESAELLLDLLRPPDPPPLLLLTSFRTEEEGSSAVLRTLLRARGLPFIRTLTVGALTTDEARDLALTLLGPSESDAWARAKIIADEARGNPFFINAMVNHAKKAGETHLTLSGVLTARLGGLDENARRALEIIAVSGGPLEPVVIMHALSLDPEPLASAIDHLIADHWVRTARAAGEDAVEIFHNRIRTVVLETLDDRAVVTAHGRLARALEQQSQSDPETLASHFRAAQQPDKARHFAVIAGDRARRALAFERAAKLYRLALKLRPDSRDQERVLLTKLGEALSNAGRGAEAARAFMAAAKGADPRDGLHRLRWAAEQYLISGHIDQGMAVLENVLDQVGLELAATPARAYTSRVWRSAQLWQRGLNFESKQESEIDPRLLGRVDILWSVSAGLGMADYMRAADFAGRHLVEALKAGEPRRVGRATAMEALYSAALGTKSRKRTLELIEATEKIAESLDDPYVNGMARLARGLSNYLLAAWPRARDDLEKAIEIFRSRCTGAWWEISTARYFLVGSYFFTGEIKRMYELVPRFLDEVEARGNLYEAANLRLGYANAIWLAADNPERARRQADEAMGRWSQRGFHLQHYLAAVARVQAALYAGQAEEALDIVESAWAPLQDSMLTKIQYIRTESESLRGRAAVAALHSGAPGADDLRAIADACRERLESERAPWATALAQVLSAGIYAWKGDTERTALALQGAVQSFDAMNAPLHSASASIRLAQLSGRRSPDALARARQWMLARGIKNPDLMADVFVPGR